MHWRYDALLFLDAADRVPAPHDAHAAGHGDRGGKLILAHYPVSFAH